MSIASIEPFLWLAGMAACLALHLVFHPQAPVFRQALKWLGKHPAPVLWLAASVVISRMMNPEVAPTPLPLQTAPGIFTPWPDVFLDGLVSGWRQLGELFHRAVLIPSLWPGHPGSAFLQAVGGAFSQVWLACHLNNTQHLFTEEGLALRQTASRWSNVLLLALCQWPWWWVQSSPSLAHSVVANWLLPEFFVFLAPLPLAVAFFHGSFIQAGALSLYWWRHRWGLMATFALTALPFLGVLYFSLGILPDLLLGRWPIAKFALEGILLATTHLWLFVSAALLLLRGGYVVSDPELPET